MSTGSTGWMVTRPFGARRLAHPLVGGELRGGPFASDGFEGLLEFRQGREQ